MISTRWVTLRDVIITIIELAVGAAKTPPAERESGKRESERESGTGPGAEKGTFYFVSKTRMSPFPLPSLFVFL
jgi:hypothetical protein